MYSKELLAYLEMSKNIGDNGLFSSYYNYDNIKNGIGIFTSRKTSFITGFDLTARSIDTLSYGDITKLLNFADHEGL